MGSDAEADLAGLVSIANQRSRVDIFPDIQSLTYINDYEYLLFCTNYHKKSSL